MQSFVSEETIDLSITLSASSVNNEGLLRPEYNTAEASSGQVSPGPIN